ncbi:MAG: hypothetical protein ACKVYV_10485, partial [Limisphaerales bacterium]
MAGRLFESPDENSAVVSEFLLYRLGLRNDTAFDDLIGKKLRLELRTEGQVAGLRLYLDKAGGAELTREEALALDKVRQQIP